MVEGRKKSRSMRRVKVVTPGHRMVIHYVSRTPRQARCALSGKALHGIPRDMSKLSKSERRPERPFGGVLSSASARRTIIRMVRK